MIFKVRQEWRYKNPFLESMEPGFESYSMVLLSLNVIIYHLDVTLPVEDEKDSDVTMKHRFILAYLEDVKSLIQSVEDKVIDYSLSLQIPRKDNEYEIRKILNIIKNKYKSKDKFEFSKMEYYLSNGNAFIENKIKDKPIESITIFDKGKFTNFH